MKTHAQHFDVSKESEVAHLKGKHLDEYRGIAAMTVDGIVEEKEDVERDEFGQKRNLLIRHIILGIGTDFLVEIQLAFYCIPWNKAESSEASYVEQQADGGADGENPFPVFAYLHVSYEKDGQEGQAGIVEEGGDEEENGCPQVSAFLQGYYRP